MTTTTLDSTKKNATAGPSHRSLSEEADWFRALTLEERLRDRRRIPRLGHSVESDRTVAARRLEEWRTQSPFADDESFHLRLRSDALSEEEFIEILGESAQSLADRHVELPPWLRFIQESFDGLVEAVDPTGPVAFSHIIRPLMLSALRRVDSAAQRLAAEDANVPFDPTNVGQVLFTGVADNLDWMLSRTVVLEMRVADLQGNLEGEDEQARFRNFVAKLSEPDRALDFLAEYSVLARLLAERLMAWAEVSVELLERLAADRVALRQLSPAGQGASSSQEIGRLQRASADLGDSHRGGRTVRVLDFDSGFRVVYKPRSLAIDARFAELLDWLNARGAPELRSAKVIEREDYGWCQFIHARECSSKEEIERFYRRQGSFLALFYALKANDFHRENLIAEGEHPVPIDLESLCPADYGLEEPMAYESLADLELARSVTQVMLLPYLRRGRDPRHVSDPSGLGGDQDQLSADEVPLWKHAGTDRMELTRQRRKMPAAGNRPTLTGETVSPRDFRDQLVEGFTHMYRLLLDHRQDLLGPSSPLQRFIGVEVRCIFRATAFYGFILRESFHPDLLRDALDRDRLLDRLWFGFDRTKFPDVSRQLIPRERQALWQGDIPYFSNPLGSRDAYAGDGSPMPLLFTRSGLDMVRRYMGRLSEEDLDQQVEFVEKSLLSLEMSNEPTRPEPLRTRRPIDPERDHLLNTALAVGERVRTLAFEDEEGASWLGLSVVEDHGWQLRSLETDLYGGIPGVLLFLAYLSDVTGDESFGRLAEKGLTTLRLKVENRRLSTKAVGGFDGWSGIVYTWHHLARLTGRDELLDEAEDFLDELAPHIEADKEFDLMRGASGGIVPLLGLHRTTGSQRALHLARRLGDQLIATAQPMETGVGWLGAACPTQALTGFSHGAAGMAWALAELFAVTGEGKYRDIAIAALDYENSLFSEQVGNWPDLRGGRPTEKGHRVYMNSWCHGATGIGLSRLRVQQHLPKLDLSRDIHAAIESTLKYGFGNNHCLCHGDFGNLDLLLEASLRLPDARWAEELERVTARALGSLKEHGYRCGVPLEAETPGLMSGIAGIGMQLLRLAEPQRVPSVLLLDPPPDAKRRGH